MSDSKAVRDDQKNPGQETFDTIEEAISDIKQGKMIIIIDDEKRENEGDLCMAASMCTPESINFMAMYGRGMICVPLDGKRCDELHLATLPKRGKSKQGTNFTESVDAASVHTGISAEERSLTARLLGDPKATSQDFTKPGHMHPLRVVDGGVFDRSGHTEASVDIMRAAGLFPASVICEVMNDDGTMAKLPDLLRFRRKHGIKLISVKDIMHHREKHEVLITKEQEVRLPTEFGEFSLIAYHSKIDDKEHLAIMKGPLKENALVRIHSECFTGDVLHSLRCDCNVQLQEALRRIGREGGVVLYLRQEGRGIGLVNKLKAYALQDKGHDTVESNKMLGFEADERNYSVAYQILKDLGLKKIRLLTNNPVKIEDLEKYGISVERVALQLPTNPHNEKYMKTKKEKMRHILE